MLKPRVAFNQYHFFTFPTAGTLKPLFQFLFFSSVCTPIENAHHAAVCSRVVQDYTFVQIKYSHDYAAVVCLVNHDRQFVKLFGTYFSIQKLSNQVFFFVINKYFSPYILNVILNIKSDCDCPILFRTREAVIYAR